MAIIIPCLSCFGDQIASTLQNKVGELVSALWDWSLGWPANLILLGRNSEQLFAEVVELRERREDTRRRVMNEEAQPSMERKSQVEGLMERARQVEAQVDVFRAALGRPHAVLVSGLCLGRAAVDNLKRVRELKEQLAAFTEVVGAAVPDAGTLEEEMVELRSMRESLLRKVMVAEAADSQMKRTPAVKVWLDMVDPIDADVSQFLRRSGGANVPGDDDEVVEKLRLVRKAKSRWNFDGAEVVTRVLPDAVDKVHSKPVSAIVGGDKNLAMIRSFLGDPDVGIIGVCGMGGIGKTTLLKQINNEPCAGGSTAFFDVVISVTVSRQSSAAAIKEQDEGAASDPTLLAKQKARAVLAIQREIGERIGLPLEEDYGGAGDPARLSQNQAKALFKSLSGKRFLLLLDDVWEPLDLERIGVPVPGDGNGCKIVIATRSEEVCIDMDAKTVNVDLLDEAQSWELFRRSVRDDAVLADRSIRPLAEKVVAQCGRLPLALVTVGRALANKKLPAQWSAAVTALLENAEQLRGMEAVLQALKFSFDSLRSGALRRCLLYCSLFPEDYEIDREQLVEYWIGEGLIDGGAGLGEEDDGAGAVGKARDIGQVQIADLQAARLLESGGNDSVKLHDCVRDMALWLTSGRLPGYGAGDTFLVHAGRGPDAPLPATARWVKATKISFMKNTNLILPDKVPPCPETSTLLANGNPYIAGVGDALLASLPMLRVLDLSGAARLYGLPASIGALVHLRYLDISFSRVVSLPAEMGRLVNLRQLKMRGTSYLQNVPLEALAPLSALRLLDMYRSNYTWSSEQGGGAAGAGEDGRRREVCLADLERLERLDDLGLNVRTLDCLDRLLSSRRFTSSMTLLSLVGADGMTPVKFQAAVGCFGRLQTLQLNSCRALDELHFGGGQMTSLRFLDLQYLPLSRVVVAGDGDCALRCLERLELTGCHSLRHITWAGDLPCLRSIKVLFCNGMEELLAASGEEEPTPAGGDPDSDGGGAFPMLRTMDIQMMPLLRSIAPRPLLLGSLESLNVYDCPALKKLPLAAAAAGKLRMMRGVQTWWDGLEWEDQNIKNRFQPHFVDVFKN